MEQIIFQIILLVVGVGSTVVIAYLFKWKFKTTIEKIYEESYNHQIAILIKHMNNFDANFKNFYETFESEIIEIRKLPYRHFIIFLNELKINEPYGAPISKSNSIEIKNYFDKFSSFYKTSKKTSITGMKFHASLIKEHMNKNEIYLTLNMRNYIEMYMASTLFYVSGFRTKQNFSNELKRRCNLAFKIIDILENETNLQNDPNIQEFINKWQEYIDDENNP